MPSIEEYAYLAGLIDGEGTIRLNGRYWQVKIQMTDEATITWLLETFGGTPTRQTRPAPRLAYFGWWVSRQRLILELLEAVRPYMITKAARADAAIESLRNEIGPLVTPE